jgi:ABC-type amino acid transport system permease subunit
MNHEYFSSVVLAILIAFLISLVLWRRQRKHRVPVGVARMTMIYFVAALTFLLCLLSSMLSAQYAGLELWKWSKEAVQVGSTLVAYLVAGRVLARLQKKALSHR